MFRSTKEILHSKEDVLTEMDSGSYESEDQGGRGGREQD
jgi:hypothetical protein